MHPRFMTHHERRRRRARTKSRATGETSLSAREGNFSSTSIMSSSMCVVETSSAGREYKVRDMAQADFGCVRCADALDANSFDSRATEGTTTRMIRTSRVRGGDRDGGDRCARGRAREGGTRA